MEEKSQIRSKAATIASKNKIKQPSRFRQPTVLTELRKESQLIARNPQRFLESFADGKSTPTRADTTSLTALLNSVDDKTQNHYKKKTEDFQKKHNLSKTRTLLLNMSSNSNLVRGHKIGEAGDSNILPGSGRASTVPSANSRKSSQSTLDNFDYYGEKFDKNSSEDVEKAIETFLDQIKNSDIDSIIVWISTMATMKDFKLPYGLPANIRMPKDPDSVEDPELSSYIETACDEFLLLDAEYHTKLMEISKNLETNFEANKCSRWSSKDSALLYYIITALEDDDQKSSALFQSDLTRRLFPEFNEEQILAQKYRLKMKRAWEERRDSIIKDWVRDKEDLQNKINTGWDDIQEKQVKKLEMALERKKQKERCKYWKDLLETMRKNKRLKIRRIQVMVEPYEKLMERREITRIEDEEKKRRKQTQLVNQYKRDRIIRDQKNREEEKRLEKKLEENAKQQAKYNRTRVHVRQFEYEVKQEAQKNLEKLKEEERQLKAALLEKSKYKVELDYDPSGVLSDTHSSLIRRHEVQSLLENQEDAAMVKFFNERYSFSSESVWKDKRVRLEAKLRDAGLIDSTYARQVLMAMEPKSKPHLNSQIKFDSSD